jgi:hypothetical protein
VEETAPVITTVVEERGEKHMVERYIAKINPKSRLSYIRKALHNVLGVRVAAVRNDCTVVMYSEDTNVDDVLATISVIRRQLEQSLLNKCGCQN